ncbi:MAG: 2OG-Fe(II) oxygenase family protein [Pseudomonadota bacterium]
MEIPVIAVDRLMEGVADGEVMRGAVSSGFLTLSGVDDAFDLAARRDLLRTFFTAGSEARARTIRNKYDPAAKNVYRGHFAAEPEKNALVEGFDIGPDLADPTRAGDGSDPLTEPTPRPGIPGWDAAAAHYIDAMMRIGGALTRALLRGLGEDEGLEAKIFAGSISTLRLLRYPEHAGEVFGPDRRLMTREGERFVMTKAHTDSGFVTLLWQDGTGGLQAESPEGWIDVPPAPGGLVVNFGQMLGDWTGGRIRATRHRVLGGRAERFSVPFFFEPGVDAVIEPLSGGAEPFVYGDFLWERMRQFPNMQGLIRKPAA